jgi:hypothetical protein
MNYADFFGSRGGGDNYWAKAKARILILKIFSEKIISVHNP